MQNSEKNLEKEKKKYVKEQLIKLGFLSEDGINDYSENEISSLIYYLIEIKDGEKELIKKKKKREKKRNNHFFYSDLLNKIGDSDIEFLKDNLLRKSNINCRSQEYKYFKKYIQNKYVEKLEILRSIIRINRSYSKIPQNKFKEKRSMYKKKSIQIVDYINESSNDLTRPIEILKFGYIKLMVETISPKILDAYYNFLNIKLHLDSMTQVIIYDLLNEKFKKEVRDIIYTEIFGFLEDYYIYLKKYFQKKSIRNSDNIFFDFFIFLTYHDEIENLKEKLKIKEEICKINYFDQIKPLDKYTQFEYAIEKSINNLKQISSNYSNRIFISNFEEFPELFDLMDENGLIEVEKLKSFKKKDLSKTKENEIIYEKKKIKNNYDRIKEALLDFIKKYPIINEKNLQILKASINAIENYETVIMPFRKKLMTCVLDPKLRYSKIIVRYLRTLITKGIYYEKLIPEEFERTLTLEKKILDVFIEIFKNSSENDIRKIWGDFSYKFYQTIERIYDRTPVYNFFTENLYNKMEH